MPNRVVFAVEGIKCSSCSQKIEDAISKQTDSSVSNIDLKTGRVQILMDEAKPNPLELKKIIEELGFPVTKMEIVD